MQENEQKTQKLARANGGGIPLKLGNPIGANKVIMSDERTLDEYMGGVVKFFKGNWAPTVKPGWNTITLSYDVDALVKSYGGDNAKFIGALHGWGGDSNWSVTLSRHNNNLLMHVYSQSAEDTTATIAVNIFYA